MKLDLRGSYVNVVLSRPNVLSLLHKLEMRGSARTLTGGDNYVNGEPVDDLLLVLQVEEDNVHYGSRPAPPGRMHPSTEEFRRVHEQNRRNPELGWQLLQLPRLQFDRQGELKELLILDPLFVHLERTAASQFSFELDQLHVSFTAVSADGPAGEPSAIGCQAWSDAVDQVDYSELLFEGAPARLLIYGSEPPTRREAEQA